MSMVYRLKFAIYKRIFPYTNIFYWRRTRVYIPRKCHLVWRFLQTGEYESANINMLQSLSETNSVIFDVGANIGLISIPLLNCKECTVVSFEPSPDTAPLLIRTAKKSRFADRWQVVPKAVGNRIGELDFYTASSDMSAFNGFKDTMRAGETKKVTVPVTTIDHEWEERGRPNVSLIKIDVEGAEIQVLEGAANCIESQNPYIFLEWNAINLKAYNCDPAILIHWANKSDYRVYSVPGLKLVTSSEELKPRMLQTENFLLVPANRPLDLPNAKELPCLDDEPAEPVLRNSLRGTLEHAKKLGFNPKTVFDVGTARGTNALYEAFPNAHHVLIEPLEENRACLVALAGTLKSAECIIAAAAKESGTVDFNVHPDFDGSSLYYECEDSNVNGTLRNVPAITLDDIWRERRLLNPCLVKIDVQGAELDVLTGATEVMNNTEYIILKVSLFNLFKDAPQFSDVIRFMSNRNFVLYDVLDYFYRPFDGAMSQFDMVFVKENGMFRIHH
jgi:FkbM family methyltransferase